MTVHRKWIGRTIELVLIAAIAAGLYFAAAEGRERAGLLGEYERLRRMTGDLEVEDPSKTYVLAIPSGEPLRFAWRVHGPKGTQLSIAKFASGSSSQLTTGLSEEDAIVTARVRLTDDRGVELHTNFLGSSGVVSASHPALGRLIRGRESEVVVEQLGTPAASLEPGQRVLLRLRLSDALMNEAAKVLRPEELASYPEGEIERIEVGYTPSPTAPPTVPAAAAPGPEAKP